MKVLLIGSDFMTHLQRYLTNVEVVDTIIGYNPLGDELRDVVSKSVKKYNPDVVFVDLMMCGYWLYKESGKAAIQTLITPEVYAKEVFDPAFFRFSKFDSNFNAFVRLLVELFEKNKIFMIKSNCSRYYVIQNQLRNISKAHDIKAWRDTSVFIEKKEMRFKKDTGAIIIDLEKFYYIKKIAGQEISFHVFEDELYQDINRWILEYMGGNIRSVPSYDLCLKRYIKYQNQTIHYKAFSAFLRNDDFTDCFLQAAGREYACAYFQDFVLLKKWVYGKSIEEIEEQILDNGNLNPEFRKVVCGFAHTKRYLLEETKPECCIEMFRKGVVSSEVKSCLRKFWYGRVNRNLINSHNAGYYYAKMIGYEEKEAQNFAEPGYKLRPVLVDVYGSCIAYNPINEFMSGITAVTHNNYYMHVPCYENSVAPVEHPEISFEEQPKSEFEKNARLQFEHQIEADLQKSDGEWCLVDLYSFITPATFLYKDFCFTNYGDNTWKKLHAEKIECWDGYYQSLLEEPEFLRKIDIWISWLNKRYGEHIITVNFKVSELKIGDDDKIYYGYKNANIQDDLVQKIYFYVRERLNGYYLEFPREFLADDIGYNSSSRVHYELIFYEVVKKNIEYIIFYQPENKCFYSYSNAVRMERMLRLRKKNEAGILIEYFSNPLDQIILSLPYQCLVDYKNEIIDFYNDGITTVPQMLEKLVKRKTDGCYWYDKFIDSLKNMEKLEIKKVSFSDLPKGYVYDSELSAHKKYRKRLAKNIKYNLRYYCKEKLLCEKEAIFGVKTGIIKNPSTADKTRFAGWKAIRMSDKKIWCINQDNKREFRADDQCNTEGFHIFLATEEHFFSKLTRIQQDTICFYAQFEN